ncbi:ubiquitin-conjugating enzyme E2 J2-like [Daphnia carinata]|uniref:ubiquitin-conjugating enzyme E2 J2-like n=1 Tax=Daphnia carinata TaxID=120202 RepID=UPI00257B1842|nr:ubiquitin-conjugating enzyme E2 J2-like [Daphnia carinata]
MSKHNNSATSRLKQDYLRLKKDPIPYVVAEPLPSNILEWHYVVSGPETSLYEGGYYHGKLLFPAEFPFKPPSIYMITPNGRFKPNTRLCLSISDFHPDSWNPAWSVSTILTGLLSFMLEKSPTLGSIETTDHEKRCLAEQSLKFNLGDKIFNELFPDITAKIQKEIELRKAAAEMATNSSLPTIRSAESGNNPLPFLGDRRVGRVDYPGLLANVVVIAGFTLFAFIVKYVLKSLSID